MQKWQVTSCHHCWRKSRAKYPVFLGQIAVLMYKRQRASTHPTLSRVVNCRPDSGLGSSL